MTTVKICPKGHMAPNASYSCPTCKNKLKETSVRDHVVRGPDKLEESAVQEHLLSLQDYKRPFIGAVVFSLLISLLVPVAQFVIISVQTNSFGEAASKHILIYLGSYLGMTVVMFPAMYFTKKGRRKSDSSLEKYWSDFTSITSESRGWSLLTPASKANYQKKSVYKKTASSRKKRLEFFFDKLFHAERSTGTHDPSEAVVSVGPAENAGESSDVSKHLVTVKRLIVSRRYTGPDTLQLQVFGLSVFEFYSWAVFSKRSGWLVVDSDPFPTRSANL